MTKGFQDWWREMDFLGYLEKMNQRLDDGTYRAQFEWGNEELRMEMLETADLLFEVAEKMEEILTDLMVRKGFDSVVQGSEGMEIESSEK
jgi:hypothetical protein